MIAEALALPFMQRALLAGLLASIAAGVVGSYVVVKRMSSVSGGLAHAAFGGIGLGYFLGFDPMLGALGFGVLSGVALASAYRRLGSALDTAVSIIWSGGMALGVIFVALTPGYAPDLTTYLFGSILFVSWGYLALVAVLDGLILLVVWWLYRPLQAISFDEEFSTVVGLRVGALLLLLLGLVALAVVTLIRVVGVILAIALLTVPAETVRPRSSSLGGMMLGASVLGATCTTVGILGSYFLGERFGVSLPAGPLVILVSVASYLLSRLPVSIPSRSDTTTSVS